MQCSVTYRTDQENDVSEIFPKSLGSNRFQFGQTFEFRGPHSEMQPA